jgi:hypothetical protein
MIIVLGGFIVIPGKNVRNKYITRNLLSHIKSICFSQTASANKVSILFATRYLETARDADGPISWEKSPEDFLDFIIT